MGGGERGFTACNGNAICGDLHVLHLTTNVTNIFNIHSGITKVSIVAIWSFSCSHFCLLLNEIFCHTFQHKY